MHTLLHDIRFGFRMLRFAPTLTLTAVIALAIGVGANTAVFSVINGVLLRPLPYPKADRLFIVQMNHRQQPGDQTYLSYPTYLDLKESVHSIDEWAAFMGISLNLTGNDEPERIIGTMTSASLFPLLGVDPLVGRTFSVEEETPGSDRVVILSYRLWQRRYGGDPSVIGRNILLNDASRTVIGVMPQSFRFPHEDADFWVPLAPSAWVRNARENTVYQAVGRLSAGASRTQAQAEMDAATARLEQQYPESMSGYGVSLTPLPERVLGDVRRPLLMLLVAVLFVLLITCANIGNLLLIRATRREREIAIRLSLGAGRWRLTQQLLTESALLSLCGGAAGLLLSRWGIHILVAFLNERDVPRLNEVALDARVLGFTLLISILCALVFGMFPVLHASRFNLLDSLKEGAQQLTSGRRTRLMRTGLIVFEIASSLVLLIGAGLLINSFIRLQRSDLGFKPDHLLVMNLQLNRAKMEGQKGQAFFRELLERLRVLPGVQTAGAVTAIFIEGTDLSTSEITVEVGQPQPDTARIAAPVDTATPGYFRTMGISLLKGRDFSEQDDSLQSLPVAVVNQTFARRFWGGKEEPIGKRFKFGRADSEGPWYTVVGMVRDTRRTGFVEAVRPEIYLSSTQSRLLGFMEVVVRTDSEPSQLAGAVRNTIRSIDKDQPVFRLMTMEQTLREMTGARRSNMWLLGIFAGVALFLAMIGIYGVMSYSVTTRTHEIGVRMALGARGKNIFRLVMSHGLRFTVLGIILGVIGALWLTSLLRNMLYDVSPSDPFTYIIAVAIIAKVALLACLAPAWRATRVDPIVALRNE